MSRYPHRTKPVDLVVSGEGPMVVLLRHSAPVRGRAVLASRNYLMLCFALKTSRRAILALGNKSIFILLRKGQNNIIRRREGERWCFVRLRGTSPLGLLDQKRRPRPLLRRLAYLVFFFRARNVRSRSSVTGSNSEASTAFRLRG